MLGGGTTPQEKKEANKTLIRNVRTNYDLLRSKMPVEISGVSTAL